MNSWNIKHGVWNLSLFQRLSAINSLTAISGRCLRLRIFFISLFFNLANSSFSQNIDSLKLALSAAKNDTVQLKILNQLSEAAPDGEWQTYNVRMKALSEKLLSTKLSPAEKRNILAYYSSAITNEGFDNRIKGDYDKALELYKQGLKINQEIGDQNAIATSYNNMATVFQKKGKPDVALEYMNKSLEIYETSGNMEGIARLLNNLGSLYNSFGDIRKALDYFTRSFHIREELGDKYDIAVSLNNLAYMYQHHGDHVKAEEYYNKSLELRKKISDKSGMATVYSNLATIADSKGDYDKGLELLFKTLKLSEEVSDKDGVAGAYHNIAAMYSRKNEVDSALVNYHRSLKLREELGDVEGLAMTNGMLGSAYNKKGNTELGLMHALRGMEMARKENYPSILKNVADVLKDIYIKKGDYKKALEMYDIYVHMRDSLFNSENKKAALKTQFKYEYEKKASADSIKTQEEKKRIAMLHEQESLRQRLIIYVAAAGFLFMLVIAVLVFRGLQQKKKSNKMLESANSLLEETNREVTKQKELVEEKQKEIIDSINYAQAIQHAILTGDEVWNKISAEHFILHKPKDIVSGDYYWAYVAPNRKCVWALGDCTGHGVPGAFMSMLGNSFLNEIVVEDHIFNADQVLNRLRNKIISALEQKGEQRKDGMDMAICVWNKMDNTLDFAGANNSILLFRNGELIEYKGDKMPVGKHEGELKPFTSTKIKLEQGDIIYMYTDGYADQFGGDKGKKFKYKPLQNLLMSMVHESVNTQKQKLETEFDRWKGKLDQVDDVSVIGIRIV